MAGSNERESPKELTSEKNTLPKGQGKPSVGFPDRQTEQSPHDGGINNSALVQTGKYHTRLVVIRHGEPEYQYQESANGEKKRQRLCYGPDAALSKEGEIEPTEIAERIPKLDSIYSSPLKRAKKPLKLLQVNMEFLQLTKIQT
jgi:hypothetical protein